MAFNLPPLRINFPSLNLSHFKINLPPINITLPPINMKKYSTYFPVQETVRVSCCKVTANTFKSIWRCLTSPESKVLKVFKASLGILIYPVLTAVAITIVALASLVYIAAMPFCMQKACSWRNAKFYLNSMGKEMVSLFNQVLLFPIDATALDPKIPPGTVVDKTPILLIHGYLHNSSAWLYQLQRLREQGIGPIYTINLGSPFHSIEEFAAKVKKKAEEIAKATGRNDLMIVGHSMGGIVGSLYAANLAPPGTVKAIVTFGTPFRGSHVAPIGPGKCARQMHSAPFKKSLEEAIKKMKNTVFHHTGSSVDLLVRPPSSTPMSHDPSVFVVCNEILDCGHNTFLFSDNVTETITDIHSYIE